ncbi:STN domain-containing protein [Sphingomonas panni]
MGLVAALAASIVMPVAAGAQERRQIDFDVPAQDAAAALNDWSRATGIQILFPQDALKGRRVSGLRGRFAPRVALDRLIATLPLRVVTDTPRMVALRAVAPVANHDIVVTGKVTEPSRAIAKRA